jgi:hypothetical protein
MWMKLTSRGGAPYWVDAARIAAVKDEGNARMVWLAGDSSELIVSDTAEEILRLTTQARLEWERQVWEISHGRWVPVLSRTPDPRTEGSGGD